MSDERPLMYGHLAGWFHLLTPPHEYADEAGETLRLLEERVKPAPQAVLEMGSGGGNLASHLTSHWRMTLTDPSADMLAQSRSINPDADHLEGDMRTLRLGRTFDAVIIHDAIGYMITEQDLAAAIETAFVHLRPGGAAIFMPDWILDTFQPRTQLGGSEQDGRALRYLEWDRDLQPDGHSVITDYVIVTRDETGAVAVHHDAHTLGIFARTTWLRLLAASGFESEHLIGDEGLDIFIGLRPEHEPSDPSAT